MELGMQNAMASFGNSPIAGVKTAEPKDLSIKGDSSVQTVSVLVGDNDSEYTARVLRGHGSEMSFSIDGVTPNKPTMIEIEEIHLRRDDAIAYTVYVNDTEVYGRTYAPIADGPNHVFFDIPADLVKKDSLKIRIVNKTDSLVRIRRVWAISDPAVLAKDQGLEKKMDVVLMLNELPNNLNYDYLKQLVNSYKCSDMYNVGLCWEINYLQWGKIRTEAWLDNVINASIQTGAPLYLGINSWWAGTPSGMDGQGGAWQDAQYQQITYDPNNADGRGNWQLSSPNEFSDTPWLSMNNDYYNETRKQRIKETVSYLQQRTAELALAGQSLPPIHLYTENEPYYWPINWTQYDFEKNPNGVGDFSQWVIEDAAKDGITLDPTDGLSKEEAFWMYRNLHTYISDVGNAMADGLGYNYIIVEDGEVTYPSEQIVSDSYSHTPIAPIYPNWDECQRAWENHVLDSIHFGGEWSIYLDADSSRSLDYLLAYGSYANINAERAGFPGGFDSTDFRVLSQCYAYGLEGVVIYNVLADTDQKNVIDESTVSDTKMEVRYYETDAIYESDFSKKTAYSINSTLTGISNFRWDGVSIVPSNAEGGTLTYKIKNAKEYATGLRVSVAGAFAEDGGRLEILAGSSVDSLKSVGVFDGATQNVEIAPSFYEGGDTAYIRVRVYGENFTTAQMAGLSIAKVGIYRTGSGNGCTDGSVYTYAENRVRSQIVAGRADVENLFAKYMKRVGGELTTDRQKELYKAAYELYQKHAYGEAFDAISQAISQLLPATFVVSGHGQLGEYPVEIAVDSSAKVTVCLKEVSDEAVRFTLSASSDTGATVSLLTDSGKWSLTQADNGDYVIAKGDTAAADGKVSFKVELDERIAKEIPSEFEARFMAGNSTNVTLMSQDTRVHDCCYSTEILMSSDAVIYRGKDGTAKEKMTACTVAELKEGDYLQVKLNEYGRIVELYAWYGQMTGTVVKVEEMSLHGTVSNPFVTVKAADGTTKRFEIGYECLLHFTGATGEMGKIALVESVGLKEGQQITVTYCPYEVNERIRAMEITD